MKPPVIIPCATEEDWHARRNEGFLGASDVPSLFGVGFKSPLELWAAKKLGMPDSQGETERMTAGKFLEDGNAKWYAHASGRRVVTPQEYFSEQVAEHSASVDEAARNLQLYNQLKNAYAIIVRHPTLPLQCTPDRFIYGADLTEKHAANVPGVLQLKNVDRFLLDQWDEDEPPLKVQCQVQAEMLCTALTWGAIGAVVGGNTRRDADVQTHPEFQQTLARLVVAFMESLKGDEMPDAISGDLSVAKQLFPKATPGKAVELRRHHLAIELAQMQADSTALEKEIDRIKAEIMLDLGDAEEGTIDGVCVVKCKLEGKEGTVSYPTHPKRVLRIQKAIKPPKKETHGTPILP